MKGMFPQYEEHNQRDFADAWKHGLFVFDTNVLLNLYRYQVTTRDELINVLGQLSSRIWIPHHVALEFQRNRLKVIATQNKRFTEVKNAIKSARASLFSELDNLQLQKRHSLINPEPLKSGFDKLVDTFLSELEVLQANQQKLTDPDPLKEKIENLFDGRVGSAPVDQAEIDETYKGADRRFKIEMPPGYKDSGKDKDEPDEHQHGGIIYKRKFGDYVVWCQIIAHAKQNGIKKLVLITDDRKEDWWRKIESDGPKTIGPRSELIEEIRLKGEVDTFLMYNPEGFLKYAKEFLQARVSEETLREVRDVSIIRSEPESKDIDFHKLAVSAEQSVFTWLLDRFESVKENRFGFPDFVADRDGRRFGFEVKLVQKPRMLLHRLKDTLYRSYYEIKENGFSEMNLVLVVTNYDDIEETKRLSKKTSQDMPVNVRIIIGLLEVDRDSESNVFIPCEDSFGWISD